jgi:hypothetical protein
MCKGKQEMSARALTESGRQIGSDGKEHLQPKLEDENISEEWAVRETAELGPRLVRREEVHEQDKPIMSTPKILMPEMTVRLRMSRPNRKKQETLQNQAKRESLEEPTPWIEGQWEDGDKNPTAAAHSPNKGSVSD